MRKKILITGFEPFDNASTNPSGEWINWMQSKKYSYVQGLILPVTFHTSFLEFVKVYDSFSPDIVILTGLAQNRSFLTVERLGINWVDARIPDNDGVTLVAQKINNEGADGIFTTIPIENILKIIQESGEDIKISTSAGEYVCNDLLYKVLHYTQDKKSQATFIHLPRALTYDGIYLALESLVNRL
jgi:pyroglutamyl-peptidase